LNSTAVGRGAPPVVAVAGQEVRQMPRHRRVRRVRQADLLEAHRSRRLRHLIGAALREEAVQHLAL
jgi:hypothetical protein